MLLTDGRLVKLSVSKETVSDNYCTLQFILPSTSKQKTQLMLDFQYIPLNNWDIFSVSSEFSGLM